MFRGERQDGADPQPSLLRNPMTIAEQDSKANLRTLRRTKRTGTIPFLAGPRIGSTENGGVGGGDPDSRRSLDTVERGGEERGRRAKGIDVHEIVVPPAQQRAQIAPADICNQSVPAKVLPDQPGRLRGPIVE